MKITLQELLANIEHRTQLLAEMVQQQKEASKHWHLSRGMGTNRYTNAPWWYRVYCYLWHQLIGGDGNVQLEAVPLPSNWIGGRKWNGSGWFYCPADSNSFIYQLLQTWVTIIPSWKENSHKHFNLSRPQRFEQCKSTQKLWLGRKCRDLFLVANLW